MDELKQRIAELETRNHELELRDTEMGGVIQAATPLALADLVKEAVAANSRASKQAGAMEDALLTMKA